MVIVLYFSEPVAVVDLKQKMEKHSTDLVRPVICIRVESTCVKLWQSLQTCCNLNLT